jgi:chemotaxis protein methyltransferase CheR
MSDRTTMSDDTRKHGLSARDFTRLSNFIYDHCGIKLPPVKRTMIESRLGKRLRALGIAHFSEYVDYILEERGGAEELVAMTDLVTTNKTDFFREPEHFSYLTETVLPEWCDATGPRRSLPFNIWSAGCSTGEEPYTMAMVLSEFASGMPGFTFQISATDISTRVLETAKTAIYAVERIAPVPMALRRKYLLKSRNPGTEVVRIVPELRQRVSFSQLNFMDRAFGWQEPLDVIFCRNVVIYFDRPTQERLINKFCEHLKPGGYLFMGHSETLNGLDVPVTSVYPTVYRRLP